MSNLASSIKLQPGDRISVPPVRRAAPAPVRSQSTQAQLAEALVDGVLTA